MSRTRAILLTIILGLAGGMLAAVLVLTLPPPLPPGTQVSTGKALVGGPFAMTDHTGKRVTDKDFAGRPMLVNFGFTNCPDVCPAGLQIMAAALDKIGDGAKDVVTPLFVTVDPERDTKDVLAQYVTSFHGDIVGLTGSADDVSSIIKAYRVYAKKQKADEHGAYSVDHTSFMYLMGQDGTFLKHFPHTVDPEKLAAEIKKAAGVS